MKHQQGPFYYKPPSHPPRSAGTTINISSAPPPLVAPRRHVGCSCRRPVRVAPWIQMIFAVAALLAGAASSFPDASVHFQSTSLPPNVGNAISSRGGADERSGLLGFFEDVIRSSHITYGCGRESDCTPHHREPPVEGATPFAVPATPRRSASTEPIPVPEAAAAPFPTAADAGRVFSAFLPLLPSPLRGLLRTLISVLSFAPPFGALLAYSVYRRARAFATGSASTTSLLDDLSGRLVDATRGGPRKWLGLPKIRPERALDVDAGDREYLAGGGADSCRARYFVRIIEEEERKKREDAAAVDSGSSKVRALTDALRLTVPPRGCREDFVRSSAVIMGNIYGTFNNLEEEDDDEVLLPKRDEGKKSKRRVSFHEPSVAAASTGEVPSKFVRRDSSKPALSAQALEFCENLEDLDDKDKEGRWLSSSTIEAAFALAVAKEGNSPERGILRKSNHTINKNYDPPVYRRARCLIELRATDALLRTLRDRLLVGARDLRTAESRWTRRVVSRTPFPSPERTEADRGALAAVTAAYRAQLGRLGRVQAALLGRPGVMEEHVGESFAAIWDLEQEMGEWHISAILWTQEARKLVYNVVKEMVREVDDRNDTSISRDQKVQSYEIHIMNNWCKGSAGIDLNCFDVTIDVTEGWITAVSLVDKTSKLQRAGKSFLSGLPIFGNSNLWLVGDLFVLVASYALHCAVAPHWGSIVRTVANSWNLGREILMRRFVMPTVAIVNDLILNRRPRLLDKSVLRDAELSLDIMLADLGLAEAMKTGLSAESRSEALAAASRMYEAELRTGAVLNLVRGRSVRLILVQIQQLKAEMLRAAGAIDDLIDANRLNVQLLAAVPAVLLAVVATRLAFVGLFAIRSRGTIGSVRDLHAEMADVLLRMERRVLLTGPDGGRGGARLRLRGPELGEFVLLSHTYMSLLDYGTPLLSVKAADAVHGELQDLLSPESVDADRQAALLRSVSARHENLLK
eukprot:CAMPEP_0194277498 /NCGR_PEP_ID=MMETSP0169-20130528/9821_1 /TAXON_ID=218684 /ORGANISM="Corethron pennatum, Strain L29A3" /LENGTH=974 /DNA_ID=CAMNT_0039021497 /DNA_START=102 /DNA_END=3026 /DNA_ORIENTATION=+